MAFRSRLVRSISGPAWPPGPPGPLGKPECRRTPEVRAFSHADPRQVHAGEGVRGADGAAIGSEGPRDAHEHHAPRAHGGQELRGAGGGRHGAETAELHASLVNAVVRA